jgi:hypothetical protein
VPRPRILDGTVLYDLYKQTHNIEGVIEELEKAGVVSPFSRTGRFTIRAIKAAIERDVPDHEPLTTRPQIVEARANMKALRSRLHRAAGKK